MFIDEACLQVWVNKLPTMLYREDTKRQRGRRGRCCSVLEKIGQIWPGFYVGPIGPHLTRSACARDRGETGKEERETTVLFGVVILLQKNNNNKTKDHCLHLTSLVHSSVAIFTNIFSLSNM